MKDKILKFAVKHPQVIVALLTFALIVLVIS